MVIDILGAFLEILTKGPQKPQENMYQNDSQISRIFGTRRNSFSIVTHNFL